MASRTRNAKRRTKFKRAATLLAQASGFSSAREAMRFYKERLYLGHINDALVHFSIRAGWWESV
jgi:hypothetical protein